LVQFAALFLARIYSFVWRYIGLAEIEAFFKAGLGSFVVLVAARLLLPETLQQWRVPLSIILMDTLTAFGGVLSLRVVRRIVYERFEKKSRGGVSKNDRLKPVLLVGAVFLWVAFSSTPVQARTAVQAAIFIALGLGGLHALGFEAGKEVRYIDWHQDRHRDQEADQHHDRYQHSPQSLRAALP